MPFETLKNPAITAALAAQAAADAAAATADAATTELTTRLSEAQLNTTYLAFVQAAKNPDLLIVGAVTVDGSDLVTSAAVVWPDGKPGTLTITSRQALTNAVLAYNITHVDGATTRTYSQPAITRNSNGAATNVPQIVVT